jgi:geranylgeranyl diphosphate synthase type II
MAPRASASADLASWLDERRARIEAALESKLPPAGTAPPALHEALRYTTLAPAKRLRGVLLLAAAELLRGDEAVAVELACAVEMIHAASLILDDLPQMDAATLRRGRRALHLVAGEANAILAAVALLNAAYGLVGGLAGLRPRARVAAVEILARAVGGDGLIGGQLVDLASTGRRLDLETLEYVHSHKTGALFLASAELGGLVAGARGRNTEALRRYAKNLGLAFQITDDLLDYSGSPQTTGKDAGLDRDKTTFVTLCGIDGARQLVDDLLDTAIDALRPFGRRAARLAALAEMVRERDR